jgi:hypothetical protein
MRASSPNRCVSEGGHNSNQVPEIVDALVEKASGDAGTHIGDLPNTLADVCQVFLCVPQGGQEGLHILRGISGNGTTKTPHDI